MYTNARETDLSESCEYFVVEVVQVHACKIRCARRPICGVLRSVGACLLRVREKDAAVGACTAALSTGGSVYPVTLLFVGVKLQPAPREPDFRRHLWWGRGRTSVLMD